ncbi:myb/SANT-like DNA-binding domain-containing protein 3 [Micropterus dolomieu]|uniref:myb/SANT-like DNA-binding domain-containing protein 3 n=1 Tax=Micropterus dolomieu TaxID=147949 RepID=UPI001E8E476A|nr:myb/SANT-like DNA-binding domain-containing protein 3 [Micropterus dolomieu]
MDKGKRQRSKNFSDFERTLLKQIVSNYPIIENKQHDSATENKKKNAWTSICNEFNSNEKVSNRTLQQLQILWKNLKMNLKKTNAVARRERFKTGGGPPERPETDDLGDLLTSIIDNQQPLEDDHQSLEVLRQDESQPTTAAAAWREDGVTNSGQMRRTKRLTMYEKLSMEFHEHKVKYLKDEHEIKMKILHVDLAMKEEERNMKQQQCQCSTETSTSSGSRYLNL